MTNRPTLDQVLEIIRFTVTPENTSAFLEGRAEVERFTGSLAGHVSTELLHLGGENWLMLIRWEDEAAVKAAQQQTATSPVITEWINQTAQFVSFEEGTVRYVG
ncbi:hypothetical protein DYU11_19755 [Fibrisoma montanum]|uniref:ABM domain-containing protein n=1 Tax=Fibrisoma montanum TaxID=2305895 RepID=A0A418M6X0_9BACT|nr:antibiotic biosynthesis monooxygenase family protein [Fibrisoma montanum]RIV21633.1 hypothetical protein DYU11_19755 [Fibrisoma montanum]